METDYRRTKYCIKVDNIHQQKQSVQKEVNKDHPRARDMHAYISKNDLKYKSLFLKAYGYKCAYCGVSIDIIPIRMFEIDHIIHESSNKFRSKVDAGTIDNLALSCYDCNRAKSGFDFTDELLEKIHPDGKEVTKYFYRDTNYSIKLSDEGASSNDIINYYHKIKLESVLHRIDYLLMNMIGLSRKLDENHYLLNNLNQAIDLLKTKRNIWIDNK